MAVAAVAVAVAAWASRSGTPAGPRRGCRPHRHERCRIANCLPHSAFSSRRGLGSLGHVRGRTRRYAACGQQGRPAATDGEHVTVAGDGRRTPARSVPRGRASTCWGAFPRYHRPFSRLSKHSDTPSSESLGPTGSPPRCKSPRCWAIPTRCSRLTARTSQTRCRPVRQQLRGRRGRAAHGRLGAVDARPRRTWPLTRRQSVTRSAARRHTPTRWRRRSSAATDSPRRCWWRRRSSRHPLRSGWRADWPSLTRSQVAAWQP